MRLLAAGVRPDQQCRRRQQLRDARAGQADPHIRRRGRRADGDGRHGLIVRRAGRRAARDARPRRADARPGHAADRRCARPDRHRRRHGRRAVARSSDSTTDVIVESAIFDPVSDPPNRPALRPRSEASLRFEKGQEFRLARIGADRTAPPDPRVGRRQRRAEAASTPRRTSPGRRGSPSGRRGSTGCSARTSAADERAPARPGRRRDGTGRGALDIQVAGGPEPLTVRSTRRPLARRSSRSSRPGAATSRSKPTSPRRSPGSAATRLIPKILPDTPMPAFRDPPLEVRDAIRRRSPAPASRRSSPTRSCRRGSQRRSAGSHGLPTVEGDARGRPADQRHEPVVARTTRCSARAHRQPRPDRVDQRPPRRRRRHDLRDREGLRRRWHRRGRPSASGGGSASPDRCGRPGRVQPTEPAVRHRRREGRDRSACPPPGLRRARRTAADAASRSCIGPGRPGGGQRGRQARARGGRRRAASLGGRGVGPAGCARRRRRARPAGSPGPARAVSRGRRRRATRPATAISRWWSPSVRRRRRRCGDPKPRWRALVELRLFDVYRGAPLGQDEKSLAYRLTFRGPDRTLEEAEIEAAIAAITKGLQAEVQRS